MLIATVISFVCGLGTGCFLMHLFAKHPEKEAQAKLDYDLRWRLGLDGKPLHPTNDYERHLYALSLKRLGKPRADIEKALYDLGLSDIPVRKRANYVRDILESTIVGFGNLPVYEEVQLHGTSNSNS